MPSRAYGSGLRVDPVLVECLAALAWLTVGSLGLDFGGLGTLLLALGIAAVAFVLVENRRQGARVFDPDRSGTALRAAAGAVGAVVLLTVLLGLLGSARLVPGLSIAVTGGAFLLLFTSTAEPPTRWLGLALLAVGALSAFLALGTATPVVTQGVLGLVAGLAVLASAADRIGLLSRLGEGVR